MPDIHFASLTVNHLPEVKEIYDWYILHSTATFHTETLDEATLREFIPIGHPIYRSFMVYAGGLPAGYCYLSNFKNRQAFARTAEVVIYLKPEYCGRGLGRRAMEYLEDQARKSGFKNMIAVVTAENAGSTALFESQQYDKCAHYRHIGEKFGRLLDVVAYQKELI